MKARVRVGRPFRAISAIVAIAFCVLVTAGRAENGAATAYANARPALCAGAFYHLAFLEGPTFTPLPTQPGIVVELKLVRLYCLDSSDDRLTGYLIGDMRGTYEVVSPLPNLQLRTIEADGVFEVYEQLDGNQASDYQCGSYVPWELGDLLWSGVFENDAPKPTAHSIMSNHAGSVAFLKWQSPHPMWGLYFWGKILPRGAHARVQKQVIATSTGGRESH